MRCFETRVAARLARGGGRLVAALALLGSAWFVTGCGGGSGTMAASNGTPGTGNGSQGTGNGTGANGRLALTLQWPEPGKSVPAASKSVKAVVTSGGAVVGQALVARPTASPWTTVTTFDNLPAGTVTLTATAYPNADGSGTAQATGATPAAIASGKQTSVTETMASTIDHLALSPANSTINAETTQQLTMTAYDRQGSVVLTAPQKVTWKSDTPTRVVVDVNGKVTGFSAGTALITVTESESGKSATVAVTVNAVSHEPKARPYKSAVDLTGHFLYVADLLGNTISQFRINSDGALSPLTPPTVSLPGQPSALLVAPAPGSHYLYVDTEYAGGTISQFAIQADGTLAPLPTASTPGLPAPVALVGEPTGKFVFGLDRFNGIRPFRINTDGTLTRNGADFDEHGRELHSGVVSQDGKNLYVSSFDGVQQLSIGADGRLTLASHVDGLANEMNISSVLSASPTAPYLYLNTFNVIQAYHIKADGSLEKVGADIPFSHYTAAAVSPDGRSLYIVPEDTLDPVAQYRINPDGTLTPLPPATVPSSISASSVTISPDGKYLYVTNSEDDTISQYRIDPNGPSTPLSPFNISG